MRGTSGAAWAAFGILLFLAAWEGAHRLWGPFVMPSLGNTGGEIVRLFASGEAFPAIVATLRQSLAGFVVGATAGVAFGVASAHLFPLRSALGPVAAMLLGIPPIVWVVLALLWFGPSTIEPAFTVVMTVFPIVFGAALQGALARDPALDEMASAYGAPRWLRLSDIIAPQLATAVFPALATAAAFSWKVAVMAEVLGGGSGIGGKIETARANLDLPETMAWIGIVLLVVLASEAALRILFRRHASPGARPC
ncbi:ABC transporter permease [Rhodomicrobium sp.]|uniref:ABC transporter permease n=1 Tax=Rhodomicrobium sp. TaxID=2720632 RepID=UPI0039E2F7B9